MRSLMITAVLAAGSASLLAQSAPIKMGLWEKTIVSSIGDGAPSTMKAQSCITPEAWQRMVAAIQKPHDGCKMNTVKTGNSYTFSGTCNIQGSSLVMNGSETIQDPEHIVAESHSTTTMNGKTRKLETRSTSKYLSSSCGSVKPDDPE
jgi:hypothetical protein